MGLYYEQRACVMLEPDGTGTGAGNGKQVARQRNSKLEHWREFFVCARALSVVYGGGRMLTREIIGR